MQPGITLSSKPSLPDEEQIGSFMEPICDGNVSYPVHTLAPETARESPYL